MSSEPHPCHFCGTWVTDGYESVTERVVVRDYSGDRGVPSSPLIKPGQHWLRRAVRHWLSDCRPDLVQHEIGPLCTWWGQKYADGSGPVHECYAYQDDSLPVRPWTRDHTHFYPDGPM